MLNSMLGPTFPSDALDSHLIVSLRAISVEFCLTHAWHSQELSIGVCFISFWSALHLDHALQSWQKASRAPLDRVPFGAPSAVIIGHTSALHLAARCGQDGIL